MAGTAGPCGDAGSIAKGTRQKREGVEPALSELLL